MPPPLREPSPRFSPTTREVSNFVHRSKIAEDNGLKYADLEQAWTGDRPDVSAHFFQWDGSPKFFLLVDIWKPLLRAYFAWYGIPREQCTRVWGDIVDHLLSMEQGHGPLPPDFALWAYGCLCRFYLEDRKKITNPVTEEYDPENPAY
jgi:hypothetical protein